MTNAFAILKAMRFGALGLALILASPAGIGSLDAQTRKRAPAKRPAPPPKPPALKSGPVEMQCPAVLGTGTTTKRVFCDVLSSLEPADGIVIPMPERTGVATLTFDLHNRHTYSETLVKSGKGYARYAANVVLANLKGEVLGRAAVVGEFRGPRELFDRVGGGAGPGGVKAVAPLGSETVVFEVPADVTEVVVLGERLTVNRLDGREVFSSAGRPIAIMSNPTLEYKPKPPKPAPRRTKR